MQEIRRDETNWLDILPSTVVVPPFIPPPLIMSGGVPSILVEYASTPKSQRESNNGCMGRLRRLSSPVRTVSPSFTRADIVVTNLIVVPELSALTTFSGTAKLCLPFIRTTKLSCLIMTPRALQAEIVASVSRENRGFLTVDSPSTRDATAIAL